MNRKEITNCLLMATTYYYVKKNYSVYREVGVRDWGRRRVDFIAFNTKANFVGVEIKSGKEDWLTDSKWIDYLNTPLFDKFYFCISHMLYESPFYNTIKEACKLENVGILVLGKNGKIFCCCNAKTRETDISVKRKMLAKLAWRGGDSRHNIKRISRVYL